MHNLFWKIETVSERTEKHYLKLRRAVFNMEFVL